MIKGGSRTGGTGPVVKKRGGAIKKAGGGGVNAGSKAGSAPNPGQKAGSAPNPGQKAGSRGGSGYSGWIGIMNAGNKALNNPVSGANFSYPKEVIQAVRGKKTGGVVKKATGGCIPKGPIKKAGGGSVRRGGDSAASRDAGYRTANESLKNIQDTLRNSRTLDNYPKTNSYIGPSSTWPSGGVQQQRLGMIAKHAKGGAIKKTASPAKKSGGCTRW